MTKKNANSLFYWLICRIFFVTLDKFLDKPSETSFEFSASAKKINGFILFCARFFVTLQEFSAFLCIKAVWEIEEKLGYELATVLNSTFCYKLHQRTPDNEPPAVL